jgi:uncharacterized membrane protein YidH (DUF202 family)
VDAVLPHAAPQRAGVDPEHVGRTAASLNSPVQAIERGDDLIALDLRKRAPFGEYCVVHRAVGSGVLADLQSGSAARDECPLDKRKVSMLRILGILLVVAGVAGLALGTFEYTQTKQIAKIGSLDLKAKEEKSATIPPLASGAVLAVGVVLLFAARKK